MFVTPQYCARCGELVETRIVKGRARAVCSACQTVFYRNPLPVAAAVVLNDRREALLVRRAREPHRGMWCLPMGFSEIGETIAEAALRELKEEAGIDARVLRLIDADSLDSDHYGDLLIVTFELEKVGGSEQAGDDADEVRYFPIGRHPPLAFRSNEKALQICGAAHLEGWAIRDSFQALQAGEEKALLSDALVSLIQEHAAEIVEGWLQDVSANPTTPSYRQADVAELRARAAGAISQLGHWLRGTGAAGEISAVYRELGRARRGQGFSAHELLSALMLLKKHVWDFVCARGVRERPIDAYRILELSRLMAAFFDRAAYHTLRGFGE